MKYTMQCLLMTLSLFALGCSKEITVSGKAFYVSKPSIYLKEKGGPKPYIGMQVFFVDSSRAKELQLVTETWRNNEYKERRLAYNKSVDEYNKKLERYQSLSDTAKVSSFEVEAMKSAEMDYKIREISLENTWEEYSIDADSFQEILAKEKSAITDENGTFSIILEEGKTYHIVAEAEKNGAEWHFDYEADVTPLILTTSNSIYAN